MTQRAIWNPETGITGLEVDPTDLAASEMPGLKDAWSAQRTGLSASGRLTDFIDRLSREWAVEAGAVEALYDIEDDAARSLIEDGFQAESLDEESTNRPRDHVIQLLRDQKEAIESVFKLADADHDLSVSHIKELHACLTRNQETAEGMDEQGNPFEIPLPKGEWKTQANYPVRDGVTRVCCPPERVGSEMDRLVDIHAEYLENNVPGEVRAAWLHHRITQIQPFQDGNGRVARAVASLVMLMDGLLPMVVTRADAEKYFDALVRADKKDLKPLVGLVTRLQMVQLRKATEVPKNIPVADDVESTLDGLLMAADKIAGEKNAALDSVFKLALVVEEDIHKRLNAIQPKLEAELQRVSAGAVAFVNRSASGTEYFFRNQIFENAKANLNYFANIKEHKSWVSINMRWPQRVQLVFAIHGIGRSFNGKLICAPFLEFRDSDKISDIPNTLVNVTDKGFVFSYSEKEKDVLERFRPWRESVISTALAKVAENL